MRQDFIFQVMAFIFYISCFLRPLKILNLYLLELESLTFILDPSLFIFYLFLLFGKADSSLILCFQFLYHLSIGIIITEHLLYPYGGFRLGWLWRELLVYFIQQLFVRNYLSENTMLFIQIRLLRKTNEKLALIGTRAWISHT